MGSSWTGLSKWGTRPSRGYGEGATIKKESAREFLGSCREDLHAWEMSVSNTVEFLDQRILSSSSSLGPYNCKALYYQAANNCAEYAKQASSKWPWICLFGLFYKIIGCVNFWGWHWWVFEPRVSAYSNKQPRSQYTEVTFDSLIHYCISWNLEVFGIIFWNILFLPFSFLFFWDSYYAYVSMLECVPRALFILIFSFCSSAWIISIGQSSSSDSSTCSNTLLNLFSECLICYCTLQL